MRWEYSCRAGRVMPVGLTRGQSVALFQMVGLPQYRWGTGKDAGEEALLPYASSKVPLLPIVLKVEMGEGLGERPEG